MSRSTPRIITGRRYVGEQYFFATGWLIHKPNLNGYGADALVPVTLLTTDGEIVRDVLARVIDIAGITPRDFRNFTERMLWRVIETDMSGCAQFAFAELGRRERHEIEQREREVADRIARSRRAADMLTGRV